MNESSAQLALLVIDKSFAEAVNGQQLEALSMKYTFLVPSAFYYELFTTEPTNRRRALFGFREFQRVDLQLSYGAKQKWANQRAKPFFNLAVLIPSCSPWIGHRVLMNRRLFKHMKRRP